MCHCIVLRLIWFSSTHLVMHLNMFSILLLFFVEIVADMFKHLVMHLNIYIFPG